MAWQQEMLQEVRSRLPEAASVEVVGSARNGSLLDGWSDLDLHLRLPRELALGDVLPTPDLWAAEVSMGAEGQVVRAVLADGRRVDLVVEVGRLLLPPLAADNDVRFLAALAVTRLGRGDLLIGTHLVLELLQACLVLAMLLRDQDEGTTAHRSGTARDSLAADVVRLLQRPLEVTPASGLVEGAVELYGRWRSELEDDYQPDWEGLRAVIRRGLG